MRKDDKIFVNMIGQYENIGDIVLRRPLLEWLRPFGELHVFLGPCPDGYRRSLGLTAGDIGYTSFLQWFLAGTRAGLEGSSHYAFKPGEIQLTLLGLREHIAVLPMIALMRLRGGHVIRVGSGTRNYSLVPKMFLHPSIALSEYVMWRDARTAAYIGSGGVMPDLAFLGGDIQVHPRDAEQRDVLVISMRGDRNQHVSTWMDAVTEYARRNSLRICVVTQVFRDRAISQAIADRLTSPHIDWTGTDHDLQEDKLIDIYRQARVVISDRLHVLIMAFTYGAMPIGLLAYPSDKINRHFEAAGISDVSVYTADMSSDRLVSEIEKRASQAQHYFSCLSKARQQLEDVRRAVGEILAGC